MMLEAKDIPKLRMEPEAPALHTEVRDPVIQDSDIEDFEFSESGSDTE